MKIFIGADHGGYNLKETLKAYLAGKGHEIEDMGAHTLDPADDYPDFGFAVAEKVSQNPQSRGILLCRSGNGIAIAANKVKGIRAALAWNSEIARKATEEDNTNVLALPADYITEEQATEMADAFLTANFPLPERAERDQRRIAKIESYEDIVG
jgi:ribose 5-phosphate isomerase B